MNKWSWQLLSHHLDRLYLGVLGPEETIADRDLTIRVVIETAGWTIDEVIDATVDTKWDQISQEHLIAEANSFQFVNQFGLQQPAMLA